MITKIANNDLYNCKIQLLKRDEIEKQMVYFIENIVAETGSKSAVLDDDKVFLSVRSAEYLKTDFYFLSMKEVETALKHGALGNYGEYYGINMKNIYSWLKKYVAQRRHVDFHDDKKEKITMNERLSFLVKNMDKLPSLKAYMSKFNNNSCK